MAAPSSLEDVRGLADQAMRPVVGGFESVALVGFPDHSNVGDSAIWLGELAYLKARSVAVAYSCSSASYCRENLERHTDGDTPILIHGGGYFGDIWSTGLDFMLGIAADFPDRPIVVMPQTIHFESQSQLERARRVINNHHAMTICARDHRSAQLAQEYFDHPVTTAPDSAVFLDVQSLNSGTGVLYLAREDREAPENRPTTLESGIVKMDWLGLPASTFPARISSVFLHRTKKRLHTRTSRSGSAVWQEAAAASARNAVAKLRLQRGIDLLGSAEILVTDRLHAHILGVALGRPNVLLDNSYGKVRTYYETWSAGLPLVRWASRPDDIVGLVHELQEEAYRP